MNKYIRKAFNRAYILSSKKGLFFGSLENYVTKAYNTRGITQYPRCACADNSNMILQKPIYNCLCLRRFISLNINLLFVSKSNSTIFFYLTLLMTWHLNQIKCKNNKMKKNLTVGYHLAFQHNELFHLPYMAVAEISL